MTLLYHIEISTALAHSTAPVWTIILFLLGTGWVPGCKYQRDTVWYGKGNIVLGWLLIMFSLLANQIDFLETNNSIAVHVICSRMQLVKSAKSKPQSHSSSTGQLIYKENKSTGAHGTNQFWELFWDESFFHHCSATPNLRVHQLQSWTSG